MFFLNTHSTRNVLFTLVVCPSPKISQERRLGHDLKGIEYVDFWIAATSDVNDNRLKGKLAPQTRYNLVT